MKGLVNAHGGGDLKPRLLEGEQLTEGRRRAAGLPRIDISSREAGDLIMMGMGGFTPLSGFMREADWRGVCDNMQMADGLFWPIPITLSTDQTTADGLKIGQEVTLHDPRQDEPMAILTLEEKYGIDKAHECQQVFGTTDTEHPGVQKVMAQGEVNLAGPVQVLSQGKFPEVYPELFLTPAQTRALFREKGWFTVAAFQTRNPMHRSHEHLAKIALELCDGLLVHSLLGELKPGDIPAEVRTKAIGKLVEEYFIKDTVIQAGYPLDMRYAGPREALLHALFRQNYGCSRLVVGRDHAGVGDYYGAFDSQKIFDTIPADALEIKPLKIDWTFWCDRCDGMASMRTCPHEENRLLLSGSKLRKLLSEDQPVPDHFSRPEVLEILREYYSNLADDERVEVKISGHSAK